MPWPTGTTTKNDTLGAVDRTAAQIKAKCMALRTKSAAGDITAYEITFDLLPKLKEAVSVFVAASSVSGIAQHVANERGVTQQEVEAAFTAMVSAVTGCLSWIEDSLPKAGGFLQIEQITVNDTGVITPRTFNSAATAGLRTQLQAVEDAIA